MSFNSPFTGQVIQPTDVSYRSITLDANGTLTWPINGSVTDNAAARIMDVTPSVGGFSINMPPANQSSVGIDALFRNVGNFSFAVNRYDGTLIATIPAGAARYIYLTGNATPAGTWEVINFGSGSSSVDAAVLAGYGVKAITTTLNSALPVTTFSTSYTALDSDRASSYVWTGGAGILTLTAAATLGNDWYMLIRNGGTGTLIIDPDGGTQINGSATIDLQPADSCIICCSGTAFFTVGLGRSAQFNFTQLTKAVSSGSYTLTASEAANVVQKYTGTLSGNVTIVLPQTVQVYYITNQTNGTGAGYQITFTTGAGGGNAIVPAGNQVILICDSVNLLNASTIAAGATSISLADGTVSIPALNFSSQGNTGIYRAALNEFNIAVGGAGMSKLFATFDGSIPPQIIVAQSGLNITGVGTFTGGIQGGTF